MDNYSEIAKGKSLTFAIKIVFALELLCVTFVTYLTLVTGNMGLGGIIFILPLMACYCVILSSLVAIPAMSIARMKIKISSSRLDRAIVMIALLLNIVGLIIVAIGIIDIFVQLGSVQKS
ncbi:MAG: hypothetical protein ACHQTE_02510 [Candidatus Saccharimonadales bacterium]